MMVIPSLRFGSVIQITDVHYTEPDSGDSRCWAGNSIEAVELLIDKGLETLSPKFAQQLMEADPDYQQNPLLRFMTDDDNPDKGILLVTGKDTLALGIAKLKRIFSAPPDKMAAIDIASLDDEDIEDKVYYAASITFEA